VYAVEAARPDPIVDRSPVYTQGKKLRPGDISMLSGGDLGDLPIYVGLFSHTYISAERWSFPPCLAET
jgi:hypothetical protein